MIKEALIFYDGCTGRRTASKTILKINVLAGYLQLFVLSHKKDAKLNSLQSLFPIRKGGCLVVVNGWALFACIWVCLGLEMHLLLCCIQTCPQTMILRPMGTELVAEWVRLRAVLWGLPARASSRNLRVFLESLILATFPGPQWPIWRGLLRKVTCFLFLTSVIMMPCWLRK